MNVAGLKLRLMPRESLVEAIASQIFTATLLLVTASSIFINFRQFFEIIEWWSSTLRFVLVPKLEKESSNVFP